MRIDPHAPAALSQTTTARSSGAGAGRTDADGDNDGDAGDSAVVKLTAAGTTAAGAAGGTDPAIAARLARVKALVASGQYPIDLDKLASNIVADDAARSGGAGGGGGGGQ